MNNPQKFIVYVVLFFMTVLVDCLGNTIALADSDKSVLKMLKTSAHKWNRPGTIVIHSFPTPIGTTGTGHLTNTMKLVISPDFTLKTAYPY